MVFSKIELRSYQLRIKEGDVPMLAFWTRYSHTELTKIPFEVSKDPSSFYGPHEYDILTIFIFICSGVYRRYLSVLPKC